MCHMSFMPQEDKWIATFLSDTANEVDGRQPALAALLDKLGHGGFYLVMLLSALLLLLPLPKLTALIVCAPAILVSAQMASGYTAIHLLPQWGKITVNGTLWAKILRGGAPYLHDMQVFFKPHMPEIFTPHNERLSGLCCFFMAIAIVLPLSVISPVFSALGLALTSLALLLREGRLLLIGCSVGLFGLALTAVTLLLLGVVALF